MKVTMQRYYANKVMGEISRSMVTIADEMADRMIADSNATGEVAEGLRSMCLAICTGAGLEALTIMSSDMPDDGMRRAFQLGRDEVKGDLEDRERRKAAN